MSYTGCPKSLEAPLYLSCDRAMAPNKTNDTAKETEWTKVVYFHAWNTTSVRWAPLRATQERARESTTRHHPIQRCCVDSPNSFANLSFSWASASGSAVKTFSFNYPKEGRNEEVWCCRIEWPWRPLELSILGDGVLAENPSQHAHGLSGIRFQLLDQLDLVRMKPNSMQYAGRLWESKLSRPARVMLSKTATRFSRFATLRCRPVRFLSTTEPCSLRRTTKRRIVFPVGALAVLRLSESLLGCFHTTSISKIKLDYLSCSETVNFIHFT